jgi:hypothetical protein
LWAIPKRVEKVNSRKMDLKDKVVIKTPLTELWTSKDTLGHKRTRNLGKEDIRAMIKEEPIEFVFADVGHRLIWTDESKCFDIWKKEIEKHLIEREDKIKLEDYPDSYGYVASEWIKDGASPIVLLEKFH